MSFESRRALEMELEYAIEDGNTEYIEQCKDALNEWDFNEMESELEFIEGTAREEDECIRNENPGGVMCMGALYMCAKWVQENIDPTIDIEDFVDNCTGFSGHGGEASFNEDYEIDGTVYEVGSCAICGQCVYVHIYNTELGKFVGWKQIY